MRAIAFGIRSSALSSLMTGLRPFGLGEHGLQLLYGEREAARVGFHGSLGPVEAHGAHAHVEALVHLADGGAFCLGVDAGAGVERHRHARVPEVARHRAHVAAARDHHGGERAVQVVERAGKAVHPAEGGEVLAELHGVVGTAVRHLSAQDVGVARVHTHLVHSTARVGPHGPEHRRRVAGEGDGARSCRSWAP